MVFSPLDEQWELKDGGWCEGLVRNAVWLSGLAAYEEVETILERVGQVAMSDSSVWRQTQVWGERLEGERRQANAPPSPWQRPQPPAERGRMGAAMDGGMVYILGEGWKELKIGCVFDVAARAGLDPVTKEAVEQAHAEHNSYVTHLGGSEALGEKLWAEGHRRGCEGAEDTQSWAMGQCGFGIRPICTLAIASRRLTATMRGNIWPARLVCTRAKAHSPISAGSMPRQLPSIKVTPLALPPNSLTAAEQHPAVADALLTEAGFFHNNHRRMQYLELRENHWLIGSGMVESGAKQFKDRFTAPGMRWTRSGVERLWGIRLTVALFLHPGMRWTRSGVERLLPIRSAIRSDRFDRLWQQARSSPPD